MSKAGIVRLPCGRSENVESRDDMYLPGGSTRELPGLGGAGGRGSGHYEQASSNKLVSFVLEGVGSCPTNPSLFVVRPIASASSTAQTAR